MAEIARNDESQDVREAAISKQMGKIADFGMVSMGDQVWTAENLNIEVEDSWYYDDDPENGKRCGSLYTWEAAKKACPDGWHLPSDDEWLELIEYLGGESVAGKQLREGGGSGFEAILAGHRTVDGDYVDMGLMADFWTATVHPYYGQPYCRQIAAERDSHLRGREDNAVLRGISSPERGLSVRYIRD